ncbi:Hypothetical predicted protein [Pelobates cultripes]|uniref:Uncharacterized protein n=1 Tax=Pelobates cultripes TaxID=61616 RepID=A0AAD1RI21_PELCU|nr:Hypothetical predicted protein [Pelobates cultripes]
MATKKKRNTTGNTSSTDNPPTKSSLQRFFTEQSEPHQVNKMAPATNTRGSQPSSPATSEGSMDDTDIRAILTQLPSKKDLIEMFQRLENTFSEKLQAVNADVQHLRTRVQALEDSEEATERLWLECHTTQNQHTDAIMYLQRKLDDLDNRGRRNNLRVRGIVESPEGTTENPIKARRALKPITSALLEKQIKFRWNFPFALSVSTQSGIKTISTPMDSQTSSRHWAFPA